MMKLILIFSSLFLGLSGYAQKASFLEASNSVDAYSHYCSKDMSKILELSSNNLGSIIEMRIYNWTQDYSTSGVATYSFQRLEQELLDKSSKVPGKSTVELQLDNLDFSADLGLPEQASVSYSVRRGSKNPLRRYKLFYRQDGTIKEINLNKSFCQEEGLKVLEITTSIESIQYQNRLR